MKTITLVIRARRASEPTQLPIVAEHQPSKSIGHGSTVEDAVRDLFTCAGAAAAAERCELPIAGKP